MLKIVDWVGFEIADVGHRRCGNIREFVEMRVLLESNTSRVLESAKVPKDLWEGRLWTKHLCHENSDLE